MREAVVLVMALLLSGCSEAERPAPKDLGVDLDASSKWDAGGDLADLAQAKCGAHRVFASGCAAGCPSPCSCELLVFDTVGSKFNRYACARPCKEAWDCPGAERCGYLLSHPKGGKAAQAVCLPGSYATPKSSTGASIDCVFFPWFGRLACRGKHLVQYQAAFLTGGYSGCVTVSVVQARCAAACVAPDAGAARCAGPDLGVVPLPDLGAKPGCCPASSYSPIYRCAALGGAKVPGNPCRIKCCDAGPCKGAVKGTDDLGCAVIRYPPGDAGPG